MAALMLVSNPTRKKGKAKMATRRKPRTAAQKRATAKLVASNRTRKAAPARRRRRTSRVASAVATTKRVYRRTRTAVARRTRRAVRNQSSLARGGFGVVNLLKQSGLGAIGALALDIAYSKLPIPASLQTGNMAALTKAAVTIGAGMLAGKVMGKQMAHGAVVGALTVQLHDLLKGFATGMGIAGVTDINGISYYSPAQISGDMGMYLPAPGMQSSVGEYVSEYEHTY